MFYKITNVYTSDTGTKEIVDVTSDELLPRSLNRAGSSILATCLCGLNLQKCTVEPCTIEAAMEVGEFLKKRLCEVLAPQPEIIAVTKDSHDFTLKNCKDVITIYLRSMSESVITYKKMIEMLYNDVTETSLEYTEVNVSFETIPEDYNGYTLKRGKDF